MDIDKKAMDALAAMSDGDFRAKFGSALENAGASEEVMRRFGENAPLLKKAISSLTPSELEAMMSRVDPEAMEKIRKSIEGR